ncbi:hypothetical protein VTJ04DRAFT_10683 [Mycothermus thermophilus]|uniref:uncharacterized protein n=1 Tax=Humicola insolens TaxID=85995 RepID=UPI003742D31C
MDGYQPDPRLPLLTNTSQDQHQHQYHRRISKCSCSPKAQPSQPRKNKHTKLLSYLPSCQVLESRWYLSSQSPENPRDTHTHLCLPLLCIKSQALKKQSFCIPFPES